MKYIMENEFLKIELDSLGAELQSIKNKENGYEYLWQGCPEFWSDRAPVLFPIIGNLNEEKYIFKGKEYKMQRHGFSRKMDFQMERAEKDIVSFSICQDSSTLRQYPFEFLLLITYALLDTSIKVEYSIKNRTGREMWFSIGGHPGFNCSLKADGKKDCTLTFNKREIVNRLVNKSGYLTGEEQLFLENQCELDFSCIDFDGETKVFVVRGLQSDMVTIKDGKGQQKVTVTFSGFPYLGIWSSANAAPFICIEPWYGVTSIAGEEDELDKKQGIQRLGIDEVFTCSYEIICH